MCSYTTYSQNYYKEGDKCFDEGDYTCAETKYKELYKSAASETDMQFGEVKIQKAKLCKENLKIANQAFASLDYIKAKENYQFILDSNPKDNFAIAQIEKCNSKINEAEITRLNKNNSISTPFSYPTTDPVQSSSQAAKSTIKTNILKSEAKMRKLDSPVSNTIYTLPTGTQVNILGLANSGYYKVEYNGKIGYIHDMYFINSEIKESIASQTTTYSPEPTSSRKGKDRQKLSSFSSLGFQSGEIAKYGLLYERGGRKTVGFRFSARTSLTSQDDILNGKVTENKTEIELGPNFKLSNRVYFNIGIGYGFYDRLSNNDYVGRNYIEKTGYSVANTGIMIRLSRVVSINGGVSFMDLEKDLYKPEITFGIAFNLKSRWKS